MRAIIQVIPTPTYVPMASDHARLQAPHSTVLLSCPLAHCTRASTTSWSWGGGRQASDCTHRWKRVSPSIASPSHHQPSLRLRMPPSQVAPRSYCLASFAPGQEMQSAPSSENSSARQRTHDILLASGRWPSPHVVHPGEPRRATSFALQGVQEVELGGANVPTGHSSQSLPSALTFVPPGQGLHEVPAANSPGAQSLWQRAEPAADTRPSGHRSQRSL